MAQVGSWQVAGLGGVFRRRIWSPPEDPTFPSYEAWRSDLIARRPPKDCGLAETAEERRHKTSIFPECVAGLERLRADILVSHEAPECRDDGRGWRAIDDLARVLGVRYAFHGHHHDSPDYSKSFSRLGFEAYAVGFRGITALDREGKVTVIRPGDYDASAVCAGRRAMMNRDQNLARQEIDEFFKMHPDAAAFFIVAGLELEYVRMAIFGVLTEDVQPGNKQGYAMIVRRVVAQRERDRLGLATGESAGPDVGGGPSCASFDDLPPPVMTTAPD